MTDIGGEANYFDTEYLVISKSFEHFSLSAGYGHNSTERNYFQKPLDGLFAGLQYTPNDWLQFYTEHDANDWNLGLGLSTPESWSKDFRLHIKTLLYSSFDGSNTSDNKQFYTVALEVPLAGSAPLSRRKTKPHTTKQPRLQLPPHTNGRRPNGSPQKAAEQTTLPSAPLSTLKTADNTLACVRQAFTKQGFEQLQIRRRGQLLSATFENNTYNVNELDAIGVALGTLALCADERKDTEIQITLLNQSMPVISIKTGTLQYRRFLKYERAYAPLKISDDTPDWITTPGFSVSKLRLTLSPKITSGIATEYGIWDYSWSLQSNVSLDLWSGAKASTTYNTLISESEDFEEGGVYSANRQRDGLKEWSLQQAFGITNNLLTQFHVGQIRHDYRGIQNETTWQSPRGIHKFGWKLGSFEHKDFNNQTREYYLGSYRYYLPSLDINLNMTAGQFWEQDTGILLESQFRFRDNRITLFYKNTDAQFIGMRWTLPLTPRRDFNAKGLQVRGHESWTYSIQTRIREKRNTVSFAIAEVPGFEWEIDRTYWNNDRMNRSYINNNMERLREAYLEQSDTDLRP